VIRSVNLLPWRFHSPPGALSFTNCAGLIALKLPPVQESPSQPGHWP
jgi:hypothetical protein